MPRRKRQHLAELANFSNFLDHPQDVKGKWGETVFHNKNPIVLELGCGKGAYALALAEKFPHLNIIGIDKKGDRLWHGANNAQLKNLPNVRFMRLAIEKIPDYFEQSEVSEIWITFPDPFPRRGEAKKRLVSPQMLARYQLIVRPEGTIHLKTDNTPLFEYACGVLADQSQPIIRRVDDVYHDASADELLTIQTTFEKKYLNLGKKIHYVSWSLVIP
jgi:tRNA (guanine-N7-)-methyltransferase